MLPKKDWRAVPRPTVFIHTNPKQMVGALVAQYALHRNSRYAERFDVRILNTEDFPFLREMHGKPFLRNGLTRVWDYSDLQSFTPLRFMPPEAMGYDGRALLIDPDIFAVGDVWELLSRDMEGKAIFCRGRSGLKAKIGCWASSVMLLDCARLTHWHCEQQFRELFAYQRDYTDWTCLKLEPQDSIGRLEEEWNDFDRLTERTKMLHNTRRMTQPWKTGLPVDFTFAEKIAFIPFLPQIVKFGRFVMGGRKLVRHYVSHPDKRQEELFFGLLRECVDRGIVTEEMLREEMRQNHVRHDALQVLDAVPRLAAAA